MNNTTYIDKYIDYLKYEKKYSNKTIESYQNNLNKFNGYLDNKNIINLTPNDIENYINNLLIY